MTPLVSRGMGHDFLSFSPGRFAPGGDTTRGQHTARLRQSYGGDGWGASGVFWLSEHFVDRDDEARQGGDVGALTAL